MIVTLLYSSEEELSLLNILQGLQGHGFNKSDVMLANRVAVLSAARPQDGVEVLLPAVSGHFDHWKTVASLANKGANKTDHRYDILIGVCE